MIRSVLSIVATITIILTAAPPGYADASFQGLGDLPGGDFDSRANDVSADGSVVVGRSTGDDGDFRAFRWTSGGGMVDLGYLPGSFAHEDTKAYATSADGSVVVGFSGAAFLWTAGGGVVDLGLPGGGSSGARDTSADGSVIVGWSGSFGITAFRWTSGGGVVDLGLLPGGSFSTAHATSADGSVVVGRSNSAISLSEAFRWTAGGGMVGLGFLPGGSFGTAYATSADGSVVVGSGDSASGGDEAFRWTAGGGEAFRWTAGGGMVGLGLLPGGSESTAYATSADGTIVLGSSNSTFGEQAFLWTADDGMRSLQDLLVTDFGLDLTGWQLEDATGISADGRTIVGTGSNPDGNTEAWIATLPGPATLSLDIKPGSCPNSLNRKSRGVLPVALLGTDGFEVVDVDLSSLMLMRADGAGGSVSPHEGPPGPHSAYADVATPFEGETCDCHGWAGDGIDDLSMKFKTQALVEALQLNDLSGGELVELVVSGSLLDGTPFTASDCIRLVPARPGRRGR